MPRKRAPGSFGRSFFGALSWFLLSYLAIHVVIFTYGGMAVFPLGLYTLYLLPFALAFGTIASIFVVWGVAYLADAFFAVDGVNPARNFFAAATALGFLWGFFLVGFTAGSGSAIPHLIAGFYVTAWGLAAAIPFWWVNSSQTENRATDVG